MVTENELESANWKLKRDPLDYRKITYVKDEVSSGDGILRSRTDFFNFDINTQILTICVPTEFNYDFAKLQRPIKDFNHLMEFYNLLTLEKS